MKQIIGVANDSSLIQSIFDQSDVKACLLVFVSENYARQSGQLVLELLNNFNQESFEEDKLIQIAYPIYSNFEDGNLRDLWIKHNPGMWIPAFVFTKPDGGATGISHFGLPTIEKLTKELSLILPN